jgi:hypothetical protein
MRAKGLTLPSFRHQIYTRIIKNQLNLEKEKNPYAITPPKAPAIVAAEKNRAVHLACSFLGYQKLR